MLLVPIFAPIVGCGTGAFGYRALIGRHLPCDVCVTEEEPDAKTQQRKA